MPVRTNHSNESSVYFLQQRGRFAGPASDRRWSPYTYGVDNPVRFIDPDGMNAYDDILPGTYGLTPQQLINTYGRGVSFTDYEGQVNDAPSNTHTDLTYTYVQNNTGNVGPSINLEIIDPGDDLEQKIIDLIKAHNYQGIIDLLVKTYPDDFNAISYVKLFSYDDNPQHGLNSTSIIPNDDPKFKGAAMTLVGFSLLANGKVGLGEFVRSIFHEFIHVEQYFGLPGPMGKVYLPAEYDPEQHNEREFLAYYGAITNQDLPALTPINAGNLREDAINYYNLISPADKPKYTKMYQTLQCLPY